MGSRDSKMLHQAVCKYDTILGEGGPIPLGPGVTGRGIENILCVCVLVSVSVGVSVRVRVRVSVSVGVSVSVA